MVSWVYKFYQHIENSLTGINVFRHEKIRKLTMYLVHLALETFNSFVKILSRVVWKMLAPSLCCIPYDTQWASFLCIGEMSHLKVWDNCQYFILWFSMSWNISKSSYNVRFLAGIPPLGHLHPFCHNHFPRLFRSSSPSLWLHLPLEWG